MTPEIAAGTRRQREQQFRLLVENVLEYAIFMLDPEGHIVSWNAGAERIKGYTADEIIGTTKGDKPALWALPKRQSPTPVAH